MLARLLIAAAAALAAVAAQGTTTTTGAPAATTTRTTAGPVAPATTTSQPPPAPATSSTATTSQPAAPAQTNTSNAAPPTSTSTGVPQSQPDIDRANCEAAVKTLINQFGDCVSNFDLAYPSTSAADAAARNFISCICTTTAWVAGSPQILSASVPSCPAPDGISKGDMAAIAAECAPSSTENQRRLVIQSFHLNTTVSRKIYVPLSGLPPGVTSAASAPAAMLAASAPALAIALALAHLIL